MVAIPSKNAAGWKGVTKTAKVYQFKYKQLAVTSAISIKTATQAQVQPPFKCCYIQLLHSTALCAATSLLTCVRTCLCLVSHHRRGRARPVALDGFEPDEPGRRSTCRWCVACISGSSIMASPIVSSSMVPASSPST